MSDRARVTLQRLVTRFWIAVDAEGVALFQYVFGAIFLLAGLYGLFIAGHKPPLTLRGSMVGVDVTIWYWLNIMGPLCSLTGKSLKGQLTYAGMWMQLTGDLTLTMSLLAYIAATVQIETWGEGAYGAFLGAALCISAAITVTRDIRRLRAVERMK